MLSRRISRSFHLLLRQKASFGGGHGHDHDHGHNYHVTVDKKSTWIKYNSDPKLVSIYGVEDTNQKLPPRQDSDPFEHIRNSPFFSYNRMVYNDPWFHEDSHEPYNSGPERGYVNGQDPLQSRFLYTNSILVSLSISVIAGFLMSFGDLELSNSEASIYNQKVARDYVVDKLKEKNQVLNDLRSREAQLAEANVE